MNDSSDFVSDADIAATRRFVRSRYDAELSSGAAPIIIASVGAHVLRVADNIKMIAVGDGLDQRVLELAALLHDIERVQSSIAGGISAIAYADDGAETASEFITERLEKSETFARQIALMIERHIYNPLMLKSYPDQIEKPETLWEWALRDADLLDYIDWNGIVYSVTLRQRPNSPAWKYDKGRVKNALGAVLKQRLDFFDTIKENHGVGITVKKIAICFAKRGNKFVEFCRSRRIDDLSDFLKIADDFLLNITSIS